MTLDLDEWLTPKGGRTPGVIVSTAHLDDEERALVLGVLLEELFQSRWAMSWLRGPMTRIEIKKARELHDALGSTGETGSGKTTST